MKYCKCGKEIHPKRLKVLPNTTTCVECSNIDKLVGVPIATGNKGEEVCNELNIMTQASYRNYSRLSKGTYGGGEDNV